MRARSSSMESGELGVTFCKLSERGAVQWSQFFASNWQQSHSQGKSAATAGPTATAPDVNTNTTEFAEGAITALLCLTNLEDSLVLSIPELKRKLNTARGPRRTLTETLDQQCKRNDRQ